MQKNTLSTFDLLKFLIQNSYLQGISGSFNYMDPRPAFYGDNMNGIVEEISVKYLSGWGDPEFVENDDMQFPDHVEVGFKVVDDVIVSETELSYSDYFNPPEDNFFAAVTDYLGTTDYYINAESFDIYNGEITDGLSGCYFDDENNEIELEGNVLSGLIPVIQDGLDGVLSRVSNLTLDMELENNSLTYRAYETENFIFKENHFDNLMWEVTEDKDRNISIVQSVST